MKFIDFINMLSYLIIIVCLINFIRRKHDSVINLHDKEVICPELIVLYIYQSGSVIFFLD
jgi:hypothetical protein